MLILFLVNYFVFSFFLTSIIHARMAWRDKHFQLHVSATSSSHHWWSWQCSCLRRALLTTENPAWQKSQNHWPFSAKVKKSSHPFSSFNQRLFWSVDRVELNRILKGSTGSLKVTRKSTSIVSPWREKKVKKGIEGRVWFKAQPP